MDEDRYDLDDGDGIGRCNVCGDPAYSCTCHEDD